MHSQVWFGRGTHICSKRLPRAWKSTNNAYSSVRLITFHHPAYTMLFFFILYLNLAVNRVSSPVPQIASSECLASSQKGLLSGRRWEIVSTWKFRRYGFRPIQLHLRPPLLNAYDTRTYCMCCMCSVATGERTGLSSASNTFSDPVANAGLCGT